MPGERYEVYQIERLFAGYLHDFSSVLQLTLLLCLNAQILAKTIPFTSFSGI